jgi:predicted O-methyltransferase YrrM
MKDYEKIAREALDAPYRAQQKWTELMEVLKIIDARQPKNILEIGVYKGGTIRAWTSVAAQDATIIGVDLPGGSFGGGFTEDEVVPIESLAQYGQTIKLIAADSHKKETVKEVEKLGPFDFIFIDADHTYKGAKTDFDNYMPLLKDGGIMVLHDVVKHGKHHPDVDVDMLWAEIKEKYDTVEFIDHDYPSDWNPWGGLGCVFK